MRWQCRDIEMLPTINSMQLTVKSTSHVQLNSTVHTKIWNCDEKCSNVFHQQKDYKYVSSQKKQNLNKYQI